ncbi:MAG: ribosome maturation factor RimM [Bacteroidales bacterium]|nr:ribosome maturation factor RimM [Bacteroidales bacterium]
MIEKGDCIKVGQLTKPHGVNGELVARADSGFDADSLMYEYMLIEIDGGLVPFYVEDVRQKNDNEVIVKMQYIDGQEESRRFVGCAVYISRDWCDDEAGSDELSEESIGMLKGFKAIDAVFGELGMIEDVDDSVGANPLFVVDRNGEEMLIPIADEMIANIDTKTKTVMFRLPEGLVDLND